MALHRLERIPRPPRIAGWKPPGVLSAAYNTAAGNVGEMARLRAEEWAARDRKADPLPVQRPAPAGDDDPQLTAALRAVAARMRPVYRLHDCGQ